MPQVTTTETFDDWLENLRDLHAKHRIQLRIDRLEASGNRGKHRNLKKGVIEFMIDCGPGYRLYAVERSNGRLCILLCGGDKSSQQQDIDNAMDMADNV